MAREDRTGFQIAVPVVDALIQTIQGQRIDVLIVDPFVASHAVSENDNTKIEGVVRQWMRVAEEAACAVELVHHVRKPGGGASQETTVDDARGAGALLAKARSARVLNGMSTTEADEVGIERKDRWAFFRIDNGKANLMPRGGEARWRRMVGVPLGNRIDASRTTSASQPSGRSRAPWRA
jgi:RecA-family ATPase